MVFKPRDSRPRVGDLDKLLWVDFGYNDHFETTSIRYSILCSKTGSADLPNLACNYGAQNDVEIATITDNLDPTRSTSYTCDAWSRLSTAQAGLV
jgi:hypothetical protein